MVLSTFCRMCDSLVIVRMFFETPQILYQPLCVLANTHFSINFTEWKIEHFHVSHSNFPTIFFTFTFHSENGKKPAIYFHLETQRKCTMTFFVLTQLCFMQLFFCITTYLMYAKNCMLTTKTMMMNWMKKTTYVVVVVVVVYSHSYAHKYQHFCENSMEIRAAHIDIIYVYTLLYTLHISARTHAHTHHRTIQHNRKYTHAKRNFTKV